MKIIPTTDSSSLNYAIIITGSFLFCAKGILVKELFSYGFSASEVLALRMIVAFPFYLLAGVWMLKSLRCISKRDFIWIVMFSFVGFFLCSLLNFMGLEHVSVGLERVILFSYPSLVLLGGMLFQGQRHGVKQFIACALTWAGLALVVADEISFTGERQAILYGSFLVFLSALIYAAYLLCAKPVIKRVGAENSTTLGMILSCLFVLTYEGVQSGFQITGAWNEKTISYAIMIGVLGTVAPTYLMSYGLARVSSSSHAIISSSGPALTILVVALASQQLPSIPQATGMSLALISSTFTNLKS